MTYESIITAAGIDRAALFAGSLAVHTPVDGTEIARLEVHSAEQVRAMIARGAESFEAWRSVPPQSTRSSGPSTARS